MFVLSTILIFLLSAWVLLAVFALLFANRLIFPAPPSSYRLEPPYFQLTTGDGQSAIAAVHLQAEDPLAPVLLFSHGNGEDLGMILPLLMEFQRRGWSVFAYEYPGYGPIPANPSEDGCYAAAFAAWRHLVDECNIKPQQIFLYGRSLGGGPSVDLATKVEAGGIILDGTFTSTFRVMTHFKLVWWDRFDNISRIRSIRCPILIMHGDRDEVVPIWHGRRLFAHAPTVKYNLWVNGAGHNNLIEIAGAAYWDAIMLLKHNHYDSARV